jgi:hypothetical protein
MSTPDPTSGDSSSPDTTPVRAESTLLLKKLGIWAAFLALLYLARDFFFVAFMTFMFSYVTVLLVGWAMRHLSRGGRERAGLRPLLTVAVFLLAPIILLAVASLIAPRLLDQVYRLAGWASHVSPDSEVSRVLESLVGPPEFASRYGKPTDAAYQEALKQFRETGVQHVAAYHQFPDQEAWVEGGFKKQFVEAERSRIQGRLQREGTSSKEFEQWFLKEKVPQLQEQAKKQVTEKGRPAEAVDPLVKDAATVQPEQLLARARRDPVALGSLRQEWMQVTVEREAAAAMHSPAYLERFRVSYDKHRAEASMPIPYTFEQYVELQRVRPQGPAAFGSALETMAPSADKEERLRADFEAAKQHELFQEWWSTSSVATSIREQLKTGVSGFDGSHLYKVLNSLLNFPLDVGTALLLSFSSALTSRVYNGALAGCAIPG